VCSVIGDRCGAWILSFVLELWGNFGCRPDKFALFRWGCLYFIFYSYTWATLIALQSLTTTDRSLTVIAICFGSWDLPRGLKTTSIAVEA
jgi:hypothetical protein